MKATPSVSRRLWLQNRPAQTLLILAVVAGFLAAALFAAQAWLLSGIVDRVFRQRQTLTDVLPLFGVLMALLALRAAATCLQEILAQQSASRIKGGLRQRLIAHIYALGPSYTHGERSGELVSVAVDGIETLDEYITQYQPARYLAGLVPCFIFAAVFLLDPWTTLVLLFAGPMLILLLALIGTQAKQLTERRFLEMRWMGAFFLDMLQGIPTLKLFGRSKEQAGNIASISRHYGNTTMEVLATAFQTSLVMEWAATAATAMVALEVSLRLMYGVLPFHQALAVLLLTPEFFLPLRQLAVKYHAGATGKAAAARVFAILDTTPAEPTAPAQAPASIRTAAPPSQAVASGAPLPGAMELQFDDVSFAYEHGSRPALQGLSMRVPEGRTVALVGATGAGKTTVAHLLLRFIEPDRGSILAGGVPLASIERAAWRRQVAWVPQAPHLFQGTVADNIRLGRPAAPMDEVIAAARAAHVDAFVTGLPQGYDTPLGEGGARLSGGQRQRIAIARAFLKDAPLLILDEATAQLDRESERLVHAALADLMAGRTVLIIAHRLNLAYHADQVVVVDQGRAVETGDHRTLLAGQGYYSRLVASYEGMGL